MNRLRYSSYSVSGAVILTALSYLLYSVGGEYLLLPGTIVELYLINPVIVTISSGSFHVVLTVANRYIFNVVIYALMIYALILYMAEHRKSRRNELSSADT
jgi:hypothetical protein